MLMLSFSRFAKPKSCTRKQCATLAPRKKETCAHFFLSLIKFGKRLQIIKKQKCVPVCVLMKLFKYNDDHMCCSLKKNAKYLNYLVLMMINDADK